MNKIANGVYKMTFGLPEELTPVRVLKPDIRTDTLNTLRDIDCPFQESDIKTTERAGAFLLEIPLSPQEDIYGLGLMLKSFRQTGLKKQLRTNSDPTADTGDSHAPVPFYVSTAGYGILVDTARYVTFCAGNYKARGTKQDEEGFQSAGTEIGHWWVKSGSGNMLVDIPAASGVDVYIFCGDSLKDTVARYNLFSGGGAFVPLWGLGVLYRAYMPGDQAHVLGLAKHLRKENIPCDIFGLEPGWQTHAYSCTYEWDSTRFPDPDGFLNELSEMGLKVNLWEHAYVHPDSPIFEEMKPYAGDYYVWDGLVPDFNQQGARELFAAYHTKLKEQGVTGFKLDECDNSDYTSNWGFPNFARFPSGMDGEQMHTVFGSLYQQVMRKPYDADNQRTFGQCRQSTALASPNPYVLYSDLYDHTDFMRGMASAAFSGLLWSPEVRQADSEEELLRRMQAVVISPQAVLNCYQVPSPPWKQFDYYKNLAGEFLDNQEELTAKCKAILDFRMSLVPHLYTAYYTYYSEGIPPVRPLVMDYENDQNVRNIFDEYLIGEGLLAAPVIYGWGNIKHMYLPKGNWYDFYTGEKVEGGCFFDKEIPLDKIPLYVREGTLLALAKPLTHIPEEVVFDITLFAYGTGDCSCTLICDDGISNAYKTKGVKKIQITATGNEFEVDGDNSRYQFLKLIRIS